tara:strand:+ start:9806 stop:10036 length:231 start_codon:yes stop_codon:yes gene_type:complete
MHVGNLLEGVLSDHSKITAQKDAASRRGKMAANLLPRLMLTLMFLSIVAVGYTVKMNQAGADFAAESFEGTTFDRS